MNLKDEKIRIFKKYQEDQLNEIQSLMHERKWPKIILGNVAAAMPLTGTLMTGFLPLALLDFPPLAVAIHSAFGEAKNGKKEFL